MDLVIRTYSLKNTFLSSITESRLTELLYFRKLVSLSCVCVPLQWFFCRSLQVSLREQITQNAFLVLNFAPKLSTFVGEHPTLSWFPPSIKTTSLANLEKIQDLTADLSRLCRILRYHLLIHILYHIIYYTVLYTSLYLQSKYPYNSYFDICISYRVITVPDYILVY